MTKTKTTKSKKATKRYHKFDSIEVSQNNQEFYIFKCKASELWKFSEVNQRQEDKDVGYQRVLSKSRVNKLKNYITEGNSIPGSIIISCDKAKYKDGKIWIPKKANAAWIIDGQHRASAAAEAAKNGADIELAVVAFLELSYKDQVDFFVTINKEAKGVPSSLYLDLLKHLPKQKSEKDRLDERIADISKDLTRNSESVFYSRIVSTTSPSAEQVSLTNFARRLRPVLHRSNGILGTYQYIAQLQIIENYFSALQKVFRKPFEKNIFFRTLGFGAVWRAFPVVFSATLKDSKGGFQVKDVSKILKLVKDFDFERWSQLGSGNAAETQAGDDLIAELQAALELEDEESFSIRL